MNARGVSVWLVAIIFSSLMAACATPASAPAPSVMPAAVGASPATPAASQASAQPTAAPTAPQAAAPAVGGTLVIAMQIEPDSLDPQVTSQSTAATVLYNIGSMLIDMDPTGKFVSYLAESWKTSPDGLTYTFTLKKGLKFQDGSPLTAQDYVWTFQRAMDPKFKGGATALVQPIASVSALDESTLEIKLKAPNAPFLTNLTMSRLQPMSKTWVEKQGDQIGRQPLSAGPYKLKEWQAGQKIVLERNPDFNWGPDYLHKGAYYIQNIEYRIIPEYATIVAGMETGAIDLAVVQAKDVDRIRGTNKFQVFESYWQGLNPFVLFNSSKPPFDDVRVRQALSLAVDRQAVIKTAVSGQAVEQRGPLSKSQLLYWPGIEQYASGFDLQKAKALLAQAGYVAGSDGILAKDGKPLKITLKTSPTDDLVKSAQTLQQQFKALGVSIDIQQVETGVLIASENKGDYELAQSTLSYPEPDILYIFFSSSTIGATNYGQVKDPELDKLLDASRSTSDPTKRSEVLQQVAKYIVDKAYVLPIYTPKVFTFVSNRVKGAALKVTSNGIPGIILGNAYISGGQ